MPTLRNVVWAMRMRALHNSNHKHVQSSMKGCTTDCQLADEIITKDHEAKQTN